MIIFDNFAKMSAIGYFGFVSATLIDPPLSIIPRQMRRQTIPCRTLLQIPLRLLIPRRVQKRHVKTLFDRPVSQPSLCASQHLHRMRALTRVSRSRVTFLPPIRR